MAFLHVLCLYKKMGLRRDGTRKSGRAMIQMSIHCSMVTLFASSAPSFYPVWLIYNTPLFFSSRIRVTESREILIL